jgi:RHS repeat-associated protein
VTFALTIAGAHEGETIMPRREVAITIDDSGRTVYRRRLRAAARVALVALAALPAPPVLAEASRLASSADPGLSAPASEAPAPLRAPGSPARPASALATLPPIGPRAVPAARRAAHWPATPASLRVPSSEAWLAALAAVPPPGEAPALARQTTLRAGWSLVSVPLVAANTQASSVFAGLPAPPRVYDYVGGQTLGVGEPGFRGVVPGRAFWVLLRQPQTLSISGLAINPTLEARLPLTPGWNTVATPWLSGVEWTDARVGVRVGSETVPLSEAVTRGWIEGSLYQYDPLNALFVSFAPNAVPAGELRVWEGSALFASVTGELVLQPPPPDTQPPAISLSPMPVDGQVITAPVDVVGTVDDPNLVEWRLELAPAGSSTFTTFALGEAPVTNGTLGTLDPTLLINGQYVVRFVATDAFGQTSTLTWSVVIDGEYKVGNFSVSFFDLEVPLAGLPIRLTRTYDSRDKGRGDFGIGWRLELSKVRVEENLRAGGDWAGSRSGGAFPTYCIQQSRQHKVTITLPDGKVLQFEPTLTPECQFLIPQEFVNLGWRALPGTQGTLESLDNDPQLLVSGGFPGPLDLIDLGTIDLADPNLYRLTLPDGRAFVVHQQNGLQSIRDLNGNQLTVGPGGITHNSGAGVAFTRDGLGRITKITDPAGNFMTYAYDASGDLASFTDRENNTTTFTYNTSHGLLSITDPLGRRPIRNDYDASGRIIRHTDAFGKTVEYTHDVEGRQQVVLDRLGRARVLEFDPRGNIVREVDEEGGVTTRSFDARGNKLSETDPAGRTREWTYDANDNVTGERDALGHATARTYNARNQLLTVTDALGRVTTRTYDASGNLTSLRDAAGQVTTSTWDSRGLLQTRTDPLGRVTSFAYDTQGRLIRETDALGRDTTYTYDANGNRLSLTRTRTAGGVTQTLVTTFAYDKLDRAVELHHPDGSVEHVAWSAVGEPASRTDRLGRVTAYTFDAMGRVTSTTHPDGTSEDSTWDAEGRRLTWRDRGGRTRAFAYDGLGRATQATLPDGSTIARTYDAAGQLIARRDGRGQTTTYEYDAAGRRTKEIDPLGRATTFAYDAAGNLVAATDPDGRTTAYEYDALDRRTRTVFPDGTDERLAYDAAGQLTSLTDQAGRTTLYAYDGAGRLTTVTDPAGGTTTFAYDEAGNRVARTDPNGRTTRFEFDELGRELRRVLPDGAFETRAYDAQGQLTAWTDFTGATTTYAYDAAGRLTSRARPDGVTLTFSYTGSGQRAGVVDARGTTSYGYDALDRLTQVTYPDGRRLVYTYDGEGRRTSLTAEVGGQALTTSYAYDAAGRLATVTDPLGRTYTQAYDAAGRRQSLSYPNGVVTTFAHDGLGRLTALASAGPSGAVQSFAYTLGAAGQRTQVSEAGGAVRDFVYDAVGRLTRESASVAGAPRSDTQFTYDPAGNRLTRVHTDAGGTFSTAYTYDARDRLLLDGATTLAWDAAGRLVSRAGEADYAWDPEGRLVRVTRADGTLVEHTYDADGHRVRTVVTPPGGAPSVTDFLVDPLSTDEFARGVNAPLSQVVAESDGGGALQALYVRGEELLAVMRPDGTRFVHADGLGSIRRLTDAAGAVTDTWDFAAFGELEARTGADTQPYGFAGEPFDAASGLGDHRARWLDARVGRFVSPDPLLSGQPAENAVPDLIGLQPYAYAHGDPVNFADPSGRFEFSIAGLSISINISSSLRANNTVAANAARTNILTKLGRIPIQSVRGMQKIRQAGQQTHHVIERRIWERCDALKKLWTHVDDMPGVNLTPAEHQAFTNAWLRVFARRGMSGYRAELGLEEVMAAAQEIYASHPQILGAILKDLLPFIL